MTSNGNAIPVMTGVDANVLLRYIVSDDKRQQEIAARFFDSLSETNPGFISIVVMIEILWVFCSRYRKTKQEARDLIALLLSSPSLKIQHADIWEKILRDPDLKEKDLSDAMIVALGKQAGCTTTVTFDRRAAKIEGMRLLG